MAKNRFRSYLSWQNAALVIALSALGALWSGFFQIPSELIQKLSISITSMLQAATPEQVIAIGASVVVLVIWTIVRLNGALQDTENENDNLRLKVNGEEHAEDKKVTDDSVRQGGLGSGWVWGLLVLATAGALSYFAGSRELDILKEIRSNNFIAGIILVIVGFVFVERFREVSQAVLGVQTRLDQVQRGHTELLSKIHDVTQDFDARHAAELEKKVQNVYKRLEDFVDEHQWVKKILDDALDQPHANLRSLVAGVLQQLLQKRDKEALELMRGIVEAGDPRKGSKRLLSATSWDVELASFVAFYVMGDRDLAFSIHEKYQSHFAQEPFFLGSFIRYCVTSDRFAEAESLMRHLDGQRRTLEWTELLIKLYIFGRKHKLVASRRRWLLDHWALSAASAVHYASTGEEEEMAEAAKRAALAERHHRDEVSYSIGLAQLETARGLGHNAIEVLRARFTTRSPVAVEAFLYVYLSQEFSERWDFSDVETIVQRAVPRGEIDRLLLSLIDAKSGRADEEPKSPVQASGAGRGSETPRVVQPLEFEEEEDAEEGV